MGKVEIHGHIGSPPTRAVMIVCELIGVPCELITLDPQVKSPEFKKLNAQQQIPVLIDDGFILQESRAIIQYLMDKYAKDDSLYPKDLKTRAVINARLNFDCGTLWPRVYTTYRPTFITGTPSEQGIESVKQAMSILEDFLTRDKWVAGSKITIADISFGSIVTLLPLLKFDLTPYPKVRSWLEEVKKIEVFRKFDDEGITKLKEKFPRLAN